MAYTEKQPYVSCIRCFGRPIIPPLMTDEKRRLMRHFKALACEREAAREKQKKAAALPIISCGQVERDSRKNGVEIRATDSSPLPESLPTLPTSPHCRQLPRPSALLLRTASSSTVETGSSTTLVPSSPEDSQEGDDGTSTVTDSSERRLLRDEEEPGVQEETNGEPCSEEDSSVSTAQTTPATTPIAEDRFLTKVSVPSLCRSRSFVVERPSLALLLHKGLGRDGIADGVNVKIVKPWKSPNKSLLEDPQASFTGAHEPAATLESTGVSETFVKEGCAGCGDVVSVADSSECASDDGAKQQSGDVGLHRELGATFLRSQGQPMAAPSTSFLNACALLDRNSRFCRQLVSESGGSCVSESPERRVGLEGEKMSSSLPFVPRALNATAKDACEMPAEDVRVPGDGIALKANPNLPCGSLALPFAGREAAFRDNAAVMDETLNDVSNFQKDEEETVVDDIFADALDDDGVLSNAEAPPKFGETFVSPWDRRGAVFAPASTSSARHSMSSPVGSARSSGGESEVLAIPLDASWDAEEEEQYEDASEVCGSPDSDAGGRGDLTEDPEQSVDASPRCDRRKSGEGMLSADDLFAAHDRKMHAFRRSLMQEYALWGPSSAPPVAGEHDGMSTVTASLETSGGRPTSSTSWGVSFGDSSNSNSLPADLSSAASRLEQSARLQDTSLASSIHLDLLSETRQSLHPKWRRCFDRLTAMARGHLTRRLMKTQRVQSIIQTIRDTLECALRLHGEPHIRSGLVTPQDVELHQRLITQLTSACHELHDVFFNIPVAERMQLIGQLRSQRKTRAPLDGGGRQEAGGGRISSATQKVLERRLSKLTGRNQGGRGRVDRPTAIVRSQTFVATVAPVDTCRAAGGVPSGTTRKICRLPMYKV